MSAELIFGEVKVPYDNKSGTADTVEVAKILEAKYGLFSAFYTKHENDIKTLLINSLEGVLENIHAGGSAPSDPFAGATAKIEALFRTFLATAEIESMGIDGVPTQAALDGVSHRFKDKINNIRNKKGQITAVGVRRPSFVDTGTLSLAFRSWLESVLI